MSEWIEISDDQKPKLNGSSGIQVLVSHIFNGKIFYEVAWYWSSRGFEDSYITHWKYIEPVEE